MFVQGSHARMAYAWTLWKHNASRHYVVGGIKTEIDMNVPIGCAVCRHRPT